MKKIILKKILFLSVLTVISTISQASALSVNNKIACRVEADHSVLQADITQRSIVKITLDAPAAPDYGKRAPVNLSLVLDRSGSMGGSKLSRAKDAVVEAIKHLGPRDIFSLIAYDTGVETIIPARSAGYSEFIESKIRNIRAGGSTALFGGVSQGAAEIRKNLSEKYIHRIILLSDGLANIGPNTPEDLGRLGAALVKENISVTTIGVGTDYNEDLMAKLSQKSDGNTYFVESERDLPGIFKAELGNVLNIVAKNVKLTIEIPDGIKPISIIGREARIKKGRVELTMNQLYGDQEKYVLIEVEIPKNVNNKKMTIAKADVSYINTITGKNENLSTSGVAYFSKNTKKVKKSENIGVIKEYQLNLNALSEEKAIMLSDKGKKKEAIKTLKESASRLKAYGEKYNDSEVQAEAEEAYERADIIEKEGMTKKSRKVLRTKSYQKKNQQY